MKFSHQYYSFPFKSSHKFNVRKRRKPQQYLSRNHSWSWSCSALPLTDHVRFPAVCQSWDSIQRDDRHSHHHNVFILNSISRRPMAERSIVREAWLCSHVIQSHHRSQLHRCYHRWRLYPLVSSAWSSLNWPAHHCESVEGFLHLILTSDERCCSMWEQFDLETGRMIDKAQSKKTATKDDHFQKNTTCLMMPTLEP